MTSHGSSLACDKETGVSLWPLHTLLCSLWKLKSICKSGSLGRSLILNSEEDELRLCKFAPLASWLMLTVCLSLLHLCPPLVGHGGVAFPAVKTRTGEVFENCSSYRQDTHTQASLCTEGCSSPQQSAGGAGRGELVVQSCLLHIPDTLLIYPEAAR